MSQHVPIRAADAAELPPASPRRSLVAQVAQKMLFWACLNTLVLTAIGYYFVSERAEQRTLAYLTGYMTERIRAESQLFAVGETNLKMFSDRFLRLYNDPAAFRSSDFDRDFETWADGSLRLRPSLFSGEADARGVVRDGVSGFVGRRHPPLTPEFKRRLTIAHHLVTELGPAWRNQFENLYVTTPENALVMYWPGVPWGLKIEAQTYLPEHEVVAPTMQSRNPARKPVWTGLDWDSMARTWTVTYTLPVDQGGRHLISPSHDILVGDLVSRLVNNHPAGAYNVLVGRNGDLIGHPYRMDELKERTPNVKTLGDEPLKALYASIVRDRAANPDQPVRIVESQALDAYLCYGEIAGPGWFFVTVYPRSLVLESAREVANGLLIVGLLSFALMTLVVVGVLRDRVSHPIRQMKIASERVSVGDYAAVAEGYVPLPEDQDNEIGLLAHSFRDMAQKVGDSSRHLERTVEERTAALKAANDALERLSLSDTLTGALNRRAFDRDLEEALARPAGARPWLMLCDVDYFKLYNDTYGHVAGDEALRSVAQALSRCSNGRVYRYGGEELALLIEGPVSPETAQALVKSVAGLGIVHEKSPYGVMTISAGLLPVRGGSSAAQVIEAADLLLYEAKRNGRNRLMTQQAPSEPKRGAG